MLRFIILFVVGYVLYRSIKSWMFPASVFLQDPYQVRPAEIDDVMIKDPFCEAYFPEKERSPSEF